ncbi:uncharacterized protein PHALS_13719 [Plasmopara halstedii]|uniref:Uncharacterized protein n=1 Tax=Plasmopara halstedii TaxID=4781 RepID=A0A0P1AQL5_PLAHL|nr:uncharacterized protein PHALS_13719 [Plasmopara halstedii]CEG43526.1 hypothetical protein PHALS_13719 [Plasmopara halstedii]|eukprot:XP_024579895.1 hypothetical protein PHALS_13719 [Plasmopara halstedii]
MSDDILDNMSLSDDEMLDNLADDMLMEMEEENASQSAILSQSTIPPSWTPSAVAHTVAPPAVMPDLSQMMSQMMPMMSQMFGSNNGTPPIFGNGSKSLQQAPVSWKELVMLHVPSKEQEDWLTTIEKDATKLRLASMTPILNKPHSRSYRTNPVVLPGAYMKVNTMLATMLDEAVRSAHLEQNCQWQAMRQNLISQLMQTGISKVFEKKFKMMLRQRVADDPNFLDEKNRDRYHYVIKVLSV